MNGIPAVRIENESSILAANGERVGAAEIAKAGAELPHSIKNHIQDIAATVLRGKLLEFAGFVDSNYGK